MSSTLDRLRLLNSLRPLKGAARDIQPPERKRLRVDEMLPAGRELENPLGSCYLTTQAFSLRTERGAHPLSTLLRYRPAAMARLHRDFHLEHLDRYQNAVFLDTETTGLGTGASVYAFMVGVGTFEKLNGSEDDVCFIDEARGDGQLQPECDGLTHFVVRQFFMRSPAEELALLEEVGALLQSKELLVTFNGRSFDMPLLRARMRYNRPFLTDQTLAAPLLDVDAPHLDLLMPARRLWRRRLQSCRLANLEEAILQHPRTEADVPGYLIPQMYTAYVQTGDAREMERVFYHNREDIVSMVSLATHLTLAYDRSLPQKTSEMLDAQDWLSLAITYERMNELELAEPAYQRALDSAMTHDDRREAFRRLSLLRKRQGRWQEAADVWQLWLTSVPGNDPTPYIELAKYYEWQVRDYEQAEMWTAWALHNLKQDQSDFAWTRTIAELEHRLARIQRKKSDPASS